MNYIKNFDYWTAQLAGQNPQFVDGDVYLGYWRFKPKGHENGGDPVAIWLDGDAVCCMIGTRVVEDHSNVFNTRTDGKQRYTLADLMTWIGKAAISYEDYSTRMDTGNWPGMNAEVSKQIAQEAAQANDAAGIGHNSAPMNVFAELRDQIDALSGEVRKALKAGAAKTKEEADAAADLAERLGKLWNKADRERDTEKRPFLEKCNEIQEKWRPLLEAAAPYKDVKRTVITPFLVAEEAKRQAKLDAERAEAARLKKEAEDAAAEAQRALDAAAAEGKTELPPELAEAAAKADAAQAAAEEAEKQADTTAKTTVKAGTRGRSTSLRRKMVPKVVDRRIASGALKDEPGFLQEVEVLMEKYAAKIVAEGRPMPAGFELVEERNAA